VVVFAGAVGGWIVGSISSMLPLDYEFPERFPRLSMGLSILVGLVIFGIAFWVLSFIPSSGTDEEYDPLPWHWP